MQNISVLKAFFIFLGIFLFGALAFFTLSKDDLSIKPSASPPHMEDGKIFSGETILRMTKDEFIPSTLRVTKGTVVKFVNEDEQFWHWPASDLHPTHTLYPEFDPRQAIAPKQEWSFTFEKIGTWSMHDHLIPYVNGIIIVVE